MQVQRIQSNNINFGYNSAVNRQLIHHLDNAKKNKVFHSYIKDLVLSTNKAERDLKNAEKKNYKTLVAALISSFIPAKIMLTDMVNSLFPEINYRQKEIDAYSDEIKQKDIKKDDANWLNVLNGILIEHEAQQQAVFATEFLSKVINSEFPYVKMDLSGLTDTFKQRYLNEQDNDVNINEDADEDADELDGKDFVVHYEPNGNALKGFESLGGMKELKAELTDKVVDFLKDPEQVKIDHENYGIKLPKGVLLYGPPGCGKTTIVKHLSVEAGVPLYELTSDTKTSYWHDTSSNIDAAFAYVASKATPEKPAIIFIDDADADFVKRTDRTTQFEGEEMKTFLKNIQAAHEKNIMVIIATNKYDILDKAIARRFDTQIYVGLPDEEARVSLLKVFLKQNKKGNNLANDEEALKRLAKKTNNFPISAIEDITAEACLIPFRELKAARKLNGKAIERDVTEADFETVLAKTENQNKKIKEDNYKTDATRPSIGF